MTNDFEIFSFGNDAKGQCGHGKYSTSSIPLPTEVPLKQIAKAGGENIRKVVCGSYHTLLISQYGWVAGCGDNLYGQVGTGKESSKVLELTPLGGLASNKVKLVAASRSSSFFVTYDDTVYVCGFNAGSLGTGNKEHCKKLTKLDTRNLGGRSIISLVAGGYHCLLLTGDNKIYGWGSNGELQLELSSKPNNKLQSTELRPTLVGQSEKRISHISAGLYCSHYVEDDETMYSCGNNNYGQLGTGDNDGKFSVKQVPHRFDEEGIRRLYSNCRSTAVITKHGSLFVTGFFPVAPSNSSSFRQFTRVALPNDEAVLHYAAGFNHIILSTESDKIYMATTSSDYFDARYMVATGSKFPTLIPVTGKFPNLPISSLASGDYFVVIVFGRNSAVYPRFLRILAKCQLTDIKIKTFR